MEDDDMADGAFGTLTIGTGGEARFVGSSAGSEYLRDGLHYQDERSLGDGSIYFAAPLATSREQRSRRNQVASQKAPYADNTLILLDSIALVPSGLPCSIEELQGQLPEWEREGKMLVESYWENVNWM